MFKNIIYICVIFFFLSCASKLNYDIVTVKASDSYFINNWKKNGVKIKNIDTIKNIKGEVKEFKVKLR